VSPKYSVIITVKDRPRLLARCLQTVLWQDCPDYDVVVVDYGSSPPVNLSTGERVSVVRVEPGDETWNGCVALNVGLANASAERIVLLNCDCLMAPDLLSTVDRLISEDPAPQQIYWRRLDLTRAGLATLRLLSKTNGSAGLRSCFRPGFGRFLLRARLAAWHPLSSYGDFLVVKRAPLIELGGFDERMAGWGQMDTDMMERLKRVGYVEHWGLDLKLIHQYHPPQPNREHTVEDNIALSRTAMSEGQLVRNGGPAHLAQYVVPRANSASELTECTV
jgi:glycosyltransferase involved in cell wall biosynthesis